MRTKEKLFCCYDGTWGYWNEKKITYFAGKVHCKKYYINLGQITHYVADYFTFPHNNIYPGGLKEHCAYEEELKLRLREYLKTGKAQTVTGNSMEFGDTEELYEYILNKHETYLGRKLNVEEDIYHIVSVNRHLVEGISHLFHKTREKHGFSNS